ncbi:MAG: response regulator [Flavobacterium sp.]|nr:response regulator [Flavobacterium sp.]
MAPVHILLVEDNEGDILLTLEALHEGTLSIEVSVVKDGQDALEFIAQSGSYQYAKDPDLILLDVDLPTLDGYDVLRNIKSNVKTSNIPVIMLTSGSNRMLRDSDYGSVTTVQKPVDPADFKRVINAVELFWATHQPNTGKT